MKKPLPFHFIFMITMLFPLSLQAQQEVIATNKGKLVIFPITHGSLVLEYEGNALYIDPYGGADAYKDRKAPDLVLITDIHGDHMDKKTLQELDIAQATFIVPQAVNDQLSDMRLPNIKVLANGEKTGWKGLIVEAIPMYNLPESDDSRHPRGRGNGYLLTIGGKRIYIAGDTEDIAEMRALEKIDVAFIPMNLPYTMDIRQAASAVLEFKPKIVYPYHYRGQGGVLSDVQAFKQQVESENKEIEVRLAEWYK